MGLLAAGGYRYYGETGGFLEIQVSLCPQVLRQEDVCSVSFSAMDWNKCVRSFLYEWCNVLMMKMMIMMFMPTLIIIKATLFDKARKKETEIVIDTEYTMITTKLEIILVFGVFCPLLYPLIIVSLNSFIFFYLFALKTLKWRISFTNYQRGIKSFPFHFLLFGVLCQQMLTFTFIASIEGEHSGIDQAMSWTLLAVYIIMDLVAFYRYRSMKRKDNDQMQYVALNL